MEENPALLDLMWIMARFYAVRDPAAVVLRIGACDCMAETVHWVLELGPAVPMLRLLRISLLKDVG